MSTWVAGAQRHSHCLLAPTAHILLQTVRWGTWLHAAHTAALPHSCGAPHPTPAPTRSTGGHGPGPALGEKCHSLSLHPGATHPGPGRQPIARCGPRDSCPAGKLQGAKAAADACQGGCRGLQQHTHQGVPPANPLRCAAAPTQLLLLRRLLLQQGHSKTKYSCAELGAALAARQLHPAPCTPARTPAQAAGSTGEHTPA
jgi:hypothetical protein